MDKRNIIILGFAIVAIGLFVIPSTMSMFTGQHQWHSVRTAESQYALCERCHQNEVGEWVANSGAHATYRDDGNTNGGCFCHMVNETELNTYWKFSEIGNISEDKAMELWNETGNVTGRDSWYWRSNNTPHAAVTIDCGDCHVYSVEQLENPNEAHSAFYLEARNVTGSGTPHNSTACLACHTMVGMNITMERYTGGLEIYANHTNYTADGWTLDISINTTRSNNSRYLAANTTG